MARKSSKSSKVVSPSLDVEITDLEYALLDWAAFSLYTPENGGEPQSHTSVNVWFWPDEIAQELGITEQGVGGVASSLVKKGLVHISPNEEPAGQPSSAGISFTELGFIVWKENFDRIGRAGTNPANPSMLIEATDEEAAAILELTKPAADATSAASGFQYLTRDALQALAAADPAARAAYRIERRKAARAARKARKS